MIVALQGCCHGELDAIYAALAQLEATQQVKVDVLLCCGDFQCTRNATDLGCVHLKPKYAQMHAFHEYYAGTKRAPYLTLFVGGNHEASNYLDELWHGGWVAPRMYYLGRAGVVSLGGALTVGGLSGIYKDYSYGAPYRPRDYHIRKVDVERVAAMPRGSVDVMLSHDWPRGIQAYGDVARLKPHVRDLGCDGLMMVLDKLRPQIWGAAHHHCKYPALYKDEVRFLALDKVIPGREFLQILEVHGRDSSSRDCRVDSGAVPKRGPEGDLVISHHPEWLRILSGSEDEVFYDEDDLVVPQSAFVRTVQLTGPDAYQDAPRNHPQTERFCRTFGVRHPLL